MTKKYVGTKIVTAWPQLNYNVGEQNQPGTEGYAVKYEDGYISWSPKETFEKAYRAIEGDEQHLTFGDALMLLKLGAKVARAGWNGKGMFLFLVPGSTFKVNRPPLLGIYPEGTEIQYRDHIDMKTVSGEVVPWVCSQTDALAEDWVVVE
jgi:hypothetical protein